MKQQRPHCIVCRERYYRRNLTVVWEQDRHGRWEKREQRGHPECLRVLARVTKRFDVIRGGRAAAK